MSTCQFEFVYVKFVFTRVNVNLFYVFFFRSIPRPTPLMTTHQHMDINAVSQTTTSNVNTKSSEPAIFSHGGINRSKFYSSTNSNGAIIIQPSLIHIIDTVNRSWSVNQKLLLIYGHTCVLNLSLVHSASRRVLNLPGWGVQKSKIIFGLYITLLQTIVNPKKVKRKVGIDFIVLVFIIMYWLYMIQMMD